MGKVGAGMAQILVQATSAGETSPRQRGMGALGNRARGGHGAPARRARGGVEDHTVAQSPAIRVGVQLHRLGVPLSLVMLWQGLEHQKGGTHVRAG